MNLIGISLMNFSDHDSLSFYLCVVVVFVLERSSFIYFIL